MTSEQAWQDARSCDRRLFRDMLGSFMTGVTVVSTIDGEGQARAFTANSFTSVSLDPPMVLVCLAKSSTSLKAFSACGEFAISILGDWQREQSNAFASRTDAKAMALADMAIDGAPYVKDSLAAMICRPSQVVDAGDHAILIGEVLKFDVGAGMPLGYFRGGYVSFGLAERQLERVASSLTVGGLLERDDGIILCRRAGGRNWEVPSVPLEPRMQHSAALKSLFRRFNIQAQPSFLYSIFQEKGEQHTTMIFSMETAEPFPTGVLADGTELRLFAAADRPWELVRGEMMSGMIDRYFRERAAGCVGIYYDTDDGGRVVTLSGRPAAWNDYQLGLKS